jgi:hypothetical protein
VPPDGWAKLVDVIRCQGITKKGLPCKLEAVLDSKWCGFHVPEPQNDPHAHMSRAAAFREILQAEWGE